MGQSGHTIRQMSAASIRCVVAFGAYKASTPRQMNHAVPFVSQASTAESAHPSYPKRRMAADAESQMATRMTTVRMIPDEVYISVDPRPRTRVSATRTHHCFLCRKKALGVVHALLTVQIRYNKDDAESGGVS